MSDSLRERFEWPADALFYPAGNGTCHICDEPELPLVRAFPDVVDPETVPVCLDCLSNHPDEWELFGELILEFTEPRTGDVDPDRVAWVTHEMPDEWPGPTVGPADPWDEVLSRFDSTESDVPASRSPFETRTMRSVRIEGPTHVVVNGCRYEYTGYCPVDTQGWSEDETERANEPHVEYDPMEHGR